MHRVEVGEDGGDAAVRDPAGRGRTSAEPMSATARSEPPSSGSRRQFQSVASQQPVLEVRRRGRSRPVRARRARRGPAPRAGAGRSGCCSSCSGRARSPPRAASSSPDSSDVDRQRLLADDVLPGREHRLHLRVVEVVRRRQVNDVDTLVLEHRLEALVRLAGTARLLRGPAPATSRRPRAPRRRVRRSASTWTTPMNPVPTTAAPITRRL